MSETAYLSLGSNMEDRIARLRSALESLEQHPAIVIMRQSSVYETEPQDVVEQPSFLNMVAAIQTDLTPGVLLSELQGIERAAGRLRTDNIRRGPRTLDIDVLLYGSVLITTSDLVIPHPRMTARRFVLEPLLEIAPDLTHPGTGVKLAGFLARVGEQGLWRIGGLP